MNMLCNYIHTCIYICIYTYIYIYVVMVPFFFLQQIEAIEPDLLIGEILHSAFF